MAGLSKRVTLELKDKMPSAIRKELYSDELRPQKLAQIKYGKYTSSKKRSKVGGSIMEELKRRAGVNENGSLGKNSLYLAGLYDRFAEDKFKSIRPEEAEFLMRIIKFKETKAKYSSFWSKVDNLQLRLEYPELFRMMKITFAPYREREKSIIDAKTTIHEHLKKTLPTDFFSKYKLEIESRPKDFASIIGKLLYEHQNKTINLDKLTEKDFLRRISDARGLRIIVWEKGYPPSYWSEEQSRKLDSGEREILKQKETEIKKKVWDISDSIAELIKSRKDWAPTTKITKIGLFGVNFMGLRFSPGKDSIRNWILIPKAQEGRGRYRAHSIYMNRGRKQKTGYEAIHHNILAGYPWDLHSMQIQIVGAPMLSTNKGTEETWKAKLKPKKEVSANLPLREYYERAYNADNHQIAKITNFLGGINLKRYGTPKINLLKPKRKLKGQMRGRTR